MASKKKTKEPIKPVKEKKKSESQKQLDKLIRETKARQKAELDEIVKNASKATKDEKKGKSVKKKKSPVSKKKSVPSKQIQKSSAERSRLNSKLYQLRQKAAGLERKRKKENRKGLGKIRSEIKSIEADRNKITSKIISLREKEEKKKESPEKLGFPKFKIDLKEELSTIDLSTARPEDIEKERVRLHAKQYRLKNKIKKLTSKKDIKAARAQLRRYARVINKLRKELGTEKKVKGYEKQKYTIGENVKVDNVFVWLVREFVDPLIDGGKFKTFVIGSWTHDVKDVMGIYSDLDDLENDSGVNSIYYMTIYRNFNTKTVTVILPSEIY